MASALFFNNNDAPTCGSRVLRNDGSRVRSDNVPTHRFGVWFARLWAFAHHVVHVCHGRRVLFFDRLHFANGFLFESEQLLWRVAKSAHVFPERLQLGLDVANDVIEFVRRHAACDELGQFVQ